jgi:manganese/iron transport system permease protein/iron/zinc/copper transport system permease protein
MSILLDPFDLPVFVHGMMVALIAGGLCGLLGVYVVLRGMSYIGHGLSHAIFGGAVASYVVKFNFYIGAGLWGFLSALMVNRVARRRSIGADAAIGVVTTASFAAGLVLVSKYRGFVRNFDAVLFGEILGVDVSDVLIVAGTAVVVAAIVFFWYRNLLFTTFDPEVAEASGVNTGRIDALFSFALAATIVATMNVLGVLLVAAALVIPAVIARMLTDSFTRMLWYSIAIGAAGGFFGCYMSWFWDWPPGSSIVLTEAGLFLVVYTITGLRGRRRPLPAADLA